jgi:hypothetical protein
VVDRELDLRHIAGPMPGEDRSSAVDRNRPVGTPIADPAGDGGEGSASADPDVVERQPRLAPGDDLDRVDDGGEMIEGETAELHITQLEIRLVTALPGDEPQPVEVGSAGPPPG